MSVLTTTNEKATPAERVAQPKSKCKKVLGLTQLQNGAGRDAKRVAAAILDVLGGARSPTDAAAALAVSLPRYYMLETRALCGFLQACEPRPAGRVRSADHELAAARKQIERLQRECARSQALVRVAQRTVGLLPPAPPKAGAGGKKRKHKPTVRALKAAEVLQSGIPGEAEAVSAGEQPAKE
jgi:hypothetical protein